MTHSPLCARLNLWKATRRESPTALKSRIREDCLRSLKENRMAVFENRRIKYGGLGLAFGNERKQLEAALIKDNEPLQFDELLKLYDEVTAELMTASFEQLDHYLVELDAMVSLEDQVVCPFCIKGEINIANDHFICSSCTIRFPTKDSLQTLNDFSDAFARAIDNHNNCQQPPCQGSIEFSFDDDEYHPSALLCCSVCEMVLPVF